MLLLLLRFDWMYCRCQPGYVLPVFPFLLESTTSSPLLVDPSSGSRFLLSLENFGANGCSSLDEVVKN